MQLCHGPLNSNYWQLLPDPREEHGNVERGKNGTTDGWVEFKVGIFTPLLEGLKAINLSEKTPDSPGMRVLRDHVSMLFGTTGASGRCGG